MAKKILIGGGTGFIGSRLGELLRSNNYHVYNVSRMPAAKNISWTTIQVSGIPVDTFAVVNCAGQQFMDPLKLWTPGFKQNVQHSRVFTTKTLANAINKSKGNKPSVFIAISGVGAYNPCENVQYDEDSPITGTDFFSKLTVELEAAAKEVDPSTRLVIIRSGVVLGRWGGMIKNMFLPFFLGLGGRIGSGKQYLPWIHIDDLVRLIQFAIENPEVKGILNGVAPQVVTNAEFTNSFARALKRPALLPIPKFTIDLLLHRERAMLITKGQYVVPKRVLEHGFKYNYEKIDDACRELARLRPLKAFAKALNRPAIFPVPEGVLNFLFNPERAMLMTKGQHVTPKRVLEYKFKYNFPNIDGACHDLAHLFPKK